MKFERKLGNGITILLTALVTILSRERRNGFCANEIPILLPRGANSIFPIREGFTFSSWREFEEILIRRGGVNDEILNGIIARNEIITSLTALHVASWTCVGWIYDISLTTIELISSGFLISWFHRLDRFVSICAQFRVEFAGVVDRKLIDQI